MKSYLLTQKGFVVSFFLFLSLAVNAYDFCVDGIYYSSVATKAFVTYKGFDETTLENLSDYRGYVTIPSTVTYDGRTYDVIAIGESAFASSHDLLGVSLPNSVRSIGGASFFDCPQLTVFQAPASTVTVCESALACCTGLRSCQIPEGNTRLREMTFYMCHQLQEIYLPASIDSIGERCFEHCHALRDVYCYATQVPRADATMLLAAQAESCTLHVPESALSAYRTDKVWGQFGHIVALTDQDAIQRITAPTAIDQKINLDGTPDNGHQGIKIIRRTDGTTRKEL